MKGFAESATFHGTNICYFSRRMSLNARGDKGGSGGEQFIAMALTRERRRRPFEVPVFEQRSLSCLRFLFLLFLLPRFSRPPRLRSLPLPVRRQVVSDKNRLKSFPRGLAKSTFYDSFDRSSYPRAERGDLKGQRLFGRRFPSS